jgi:hypothetical protein
LVEDLIFMLIFSQVQEGSAKVEYKNPAKVFLSAYMIVAHTAEIMPTIGAEEEVR